MRSLNSIKNIATSMGIMLMVSILGFVTRKLFLDSLGEEYLGLNGLLTNVIGMLSLVESGVGVSIVYNLYKPLAEGNTRQVLALVQLYRKIYRYIALGILVLSIALFPFLKYLIHGDNQIIDLGLVYFIFVANTLIGYLMADKLSLVNSDQKQYKLAGYNLGYQFAMYAIKILILTYYPNYIFFLSIEFICGAIYNLIIRAKVRRLYPFIKTKETIEVPKEIKQNIVRNVKALFITTIGGYMVHSTDNILISSFIGLSVVGLYSNYTLIINQVKSLATPLMSGVKDSVGNLVSSESSEHQYNVFKMLFFINFVVISFISIMLFCLLNPFITWWLGEQYLFEEWVVAIMCINLYVDMIRSSALTFKVVSGIFVQDRYVAFITGIVNLIVSLILVKVIGLAGILLGTTIAFLTTNSWNWPRLIYKYNFKKSPVHYYVRYVAYAVLSVIVCLACASFGKYLFTRYGVSLLNIILIAIADTIIIFMTYWTIFHKTGEYKYAATIISTVLKRRKANAIS